MNASLRVKKSRRALEVCGIIVLAGLLVFLYTHTSPIASNEEVETSDSLENINITAATVSSLSAPQKIYTVTSDTPQFVLFSFDGSKSTSFLQETLDFQKKMKAEGKPINFTYFINAAYFLTQDTGKIYHAPNQKAGVSNVGFSDTSEDISLRVALLNAAHAAGNEIGSHTVGHYNGSFWTYDDWIHEFRQFNSILFHVSENNPTVKVSPWAIEPSGIVGFRAPNLGVNQELYRALHDMRFIYDASGVARGGDWPQKDFYGIWRLPIGTIYLGKQQTPVIAMDYSIWKTQSGKNSDVKKNSDQWNSFFTDVTNGYMDYFNRNYNGSRAPVMISNHFSKWNDGVYWESTKTIAEEVCGMPYVQCVTFSELVNYLNTVGPPMGK